MRSVSNRAVAFLFAGAMAFAVPAFPQTDGAAPGQSGTTGGGGTASHGGAGYTQQGDEGQGGLEHFIAQAALGNMAAIQLGQLAQQKAQDPQVKQFAQTMIDQHSKAESQLQQIANRADLQLPSSLDKKHQDVDDRLSKLSGAPFDREYMKVMVQSHQEMQNLLRKRAHQGPSGGAGTSGSTGTSGTAAGRTGTTGATGGSGSSDIGELSGATSAVDEYAATTWPEVQQHLEMAKHLEKQLNGGDKKNRPER